jgi:sodium/potassium-transporting ATPase subunit alpha
MSTNSSGGRIFAPFSNRLLLIGIVVEIGVIMLIDYTPVGNVVFGTAPIPPSVWLLMIPGATAMLFIEEFRKWLVRRRTICRKQKAPRATLASTT